jgi:hypothetical protein
MRSTRFRATKTSVLYLATILLWSGLAGFAKAQDDAQPLQLRPSQDTAAHYELLYQTFTGAPKPSLEMRARLRLEFLKDQGYHLQILSQERFEPFPAPGQWMRITVDPVMPPGGNEPRGVDIDLSHSGTPKMEGVLPPDIPAFSYTIAHQTMMVLYLTDGTLDLDNLKAPGDSITVPSYSFTWDEGRYIHIQTKHVPESSLTVDSVTDEYIDLLWEPGIVREDRLMGFKHELKVVVMEEEVAWRLRIDPKTGILLEAITDHDTLASVLISKATEFVLPDNIEIPPDAKRYRTDRLIQIQRLNQGR